MLAHYKKFLIKSDDHFNEFHFPRLENEMTALKAAIACLPGNFNEEIIISFFKGQNINSEWEKMNPELCRMVNSNGLPFNCLKDLFNSGIHNEVFCKELEVYVRKTLC